MKINKDMMNQDIAELLRAVAASYKMKDEEKNRFRIIAYDRAADAVEHLSSEAKDLWDDGKLKEVAGIGTSIEKHLGEIFSTGKSKHFKSIMKGLPKAMFEIMEVPGIGAKTAFKLVTELKLKGRDAIAQLEKAAKEGKVEILEGMGKDSQDAIQKSIKEVKGRRRRLLLPFADGIADEIVAWMKKTKSVEQVNVLGSLRRKASTVGDIDISVSSNEPDKALLHFTRYPKITRVLEKGKKTASIIIPGNRQIDLMVQEPRSYGSLLQHFTGSKHHNIALREYAQKKGMSLSEYGIKKIKGRKSKTHKFSTEEQFYNYLGMDHIPPELREDTGELEAAIAGKLPKLVVLEDVKADLQIHSDFDIETSHDLGESSMEEVITKAQDLGYQYIAFTEHNPARARHSENQIVDLIKKKKEKIDKINYSLSKGESSRAMPAGRQVIKVFNSLEIDIQPDGKLAVTDKGLEILDFALVSIHSSFRLARSKMTKRVLAALVHPKVKIFAHPTARKLNAREGIELDWPKVLDYCKSNNKFLEINAKPDRLDLPDMLVKEAVKEGVGLTLGTDSHDAQGLDEMEFGVSVARRGWATKEDIVNTRSLKDFEKMIKS